MEESMQTVTAELNTRLVRLMSHDNFGAPPRRLHKQEGAILIGKATKEQQALALIYNQIVGEHTRAHRISGEPFGINPYVDFKHFINHVLQPVVFEMLTWSVHRTYPESRLNLYSLCFDAEWNMYAMPKYKKRKKKSKTAS